MEFDPSKLQLKGSKTNLTSQNMSLSEKQTILPLNDLKLIPNKEYTAEVVKQQTTSNQQSQQNQHLSGQKASELSSESDKASSKPSTSKSLQTTNWILKVNNQFIEVKTQLALEALQKVKVQLIKDVNGSLSLQVLNTKQAPAAQTIQSPAPSQITNSNQAVINTTLLKQLSALLTEQISLHTGFKLVSESKNVINQNPSVLTAIKQMQGSLIKAQELISDSAFFKKANGTPPTKTTSIPVEQGGQTSQPSLSPQAQKIKQLLLSSGLFFDGSSQTKSGTLLTNLSNSAQKISTQLSLIQNQLNQDQSNMTHHYSSQNKLSTVAKNQSDQFQSMLTIANKLQRLISEHSAQSTHPNTQGSKLTEQHKAIDLKLNFLRAIIDLNQSQNAQTNNKNTTIPSSLNIIDDTLATFPFDFPKINSEAKSKANAILADKELSVGQLLKLMAGMLTRIQFNQLNSIYQSQQNDIPGTQSLFFEIPVSNNQGNTDVFSLRIDQKQEEESKEKSAEKKSELQWKIALTFDLEELGPLYIQVLLVPPSISSIIWAERTSTFELVQKESSSLKKQLGEIGLDVGDINCRQGFPENNKTSIKQNLIDIEA